MDKMMDKIASFTIDHLKLLPGIYVSRKDQAGDSLITTFDIRMTRPNYEPVLNTAEIHTGDWNSADIVPLITGMFTFISGFEGEVPGACAKDCGNYLDMNLPMAKYVAGKYLKEVLEGIDESRLIYPNA